MFYQRTMVQNAVLREKMQFDHKNEKRQSFSTSGPRTPGGRDIFLGGPRSH